MAFVLRPRDLKAPTILDRNSSSPSLSPIQQQVDSHVGDFVEQATDAKTLSAMMGAGMAYRLARLGSLAAASSLLPEGNALASFFARGTSYAVGLAGESATFAGLNRGFRWLEGQQPQQSFGKEFLNSALSLGSLKFFGGLGQGQNPLFQHLLADAGMVASRHLASLTHLEEKPEGDLFSQLLHAEAMNWQMKTGMGLVHGVAPRLGAEEKSLDILLKSKETGLHSKNEAHPLFPLNALAMAIQGGPGIEMKSGTNEAKKLYSQMSSDDTNGDSPPKEVNTSEVTKTESETFLKEGSLLTFDEKGKIQAVTEPETFFSKGSQISFDENGKIKSVIPGNVPDIEELRAQLKNNDPLVRMGALHDLRRFFGKEALPEIEQGLKDESAPVRSAAIQELIDLGESRSFDELRALLKDKDPFFRFMAIVALTKLGAKEAIDDIRECLKDEDREVRLFAADSLRRLSRGGQEGEKLQELMTSARKGDKKAQETLEKLFPQIDFQDLAQRGKNESPERFNALLNLRYLAQNGAIPAVEALNHMALEEFSQKPSVMKILFVLALDPNLPGKELALIGFIQGAKSDPRYLPDLYQLAISEKEPATQAVAELAKSHLEALNQLYLLSKKIPSAARAFSEITSHMDVVSLAQSAERDPQALLALKNMAESGHYPAQAAWNHLSEETKNKLLEDW